ncbi:MAG: hypothetical protein LH480_06400 [Rubrivivax sp.]|nr:hypothetical protein [Rubrivivax sp.]
MLVFRVACLGVGLLLSGCAGLLPRGDSEQPSGFDSFEAAAQAFDKVVAYRTTVEQLKELGFDVQSSPNVTLISYPNLTGRLAPDRGVPFEAIDPGIRDCIVARLACQAYEFNLSREVTRREGNFALDFLNFRRETRVTGWRFEGLLAVRDGVVLFRSHGGEPRTDRVERQVNPLGPLQRVGEGAGGRLAR